MTSFPDQVGVMLGVPLSGAKLVPEWTFSFMSLNPGMNYNIRYCTLKGHPVDEARNWIAEQAILQKCKYLFFVDEDVTLPAHTLRQLLMKMEWNQDAAIFGAIYCHKQYPPQPMVFRGNGAGPYWDFKAGETFEVSGLGMGATLIRTSVFDTIERPWFKTVDDASQFLDGVNHLTQFTEDLWFLDRVRVAKNPKTGNPWTIWADGGLLCEHWDTNTCKPIFLPPGSPPFRRVGVEQGQKKILDVGAGESPYQTDEGIVVTFDSREDVNPDYRGDARCLPFGTGEFDIVFSSHCLEHFMRDEWGSVLDEWCRVLKPTGEFRLVVPNIEWAMDQIKLGINSQNREHIYNVIYGQQTYDLNRHGMGFTPQIVKEAFEKRGFEKVDITLEGYNIICNAYRKIFDQTKKITTKKKVGVKKSKGKK